MRFRTKRILSFSTVATYLFLSGLENAIILPTAWQYLQYLGAAQEYLLGITITGFSACGAISGVVGGRLADAYPRRTKVIVILAILAMILGNLQYLMGGSVVNLIMGRLVCGLGSGAGAALLAEVSRTTSAKERTSILSLCNGLRQIGLLIGPGFQIVLEYVDLNLLNGVLIVRPFNAPGLFMAVLWIAFLLFVIVFYENLDVEYRYELLRRQHLGPELYGRSVELEQDTYNQHGNQSDKLIQSFSRVSKKWYLLDPVAIETLIDAPVTLSDYVDEFLRDDTVILFGMTLSLFFCHVSIETVIPPLMSQLFNFSGYETSLVYMMGGSVAIFLYLAVALTTRWTSDIYLLMAGWVMQIVGLIWFLIWLPQIHPGDNHLLPQFVTGIMLLYIGFPVACVGVTSLLTKCVSLRVQGAAQGLRRLGSYLGLILGPLWGGATLHSPVLQISVPLGLLFVFTILFALSFAKIRREEREITDRNDL